MMWKSDEKIFTLRERKWINCEFLHFAWHCERYILPQKVHGICSTAERAYLMTLNRNFPHRKDNFTIFRQQTLTWMTTELNSHKRCAWTLLNPFSHWLFRLLSYSPPWTICCIKVILRATFTWSSYSNGSKTRTIKTPQIYTKSSNVLHWTSCKSQTIFSQTAQKLSPTENFLQRMLGNFYWWFVKKKCRIMMLYWDTVKLFNFHTRFHGIILQFINHLSWVKEDGNFSPLLLFFLRALQTQHFDGSLLLLAECFTLNELHRKIFEKLLFKCIILNNCKSWNSLQYSSFF